ncbi:MAG: hypothetical protein HQK50_13045 [Oligoflexia bacterium]|nr:hypothetical protein [Oligoflexia bacterium]
MNRVKFILPLITMVLILSSCSSKNKDVASVEDEKHVDINQAYVVAKSLTIIKPCNRNSRNDSKDSQNYIKYQGMLSFCGFNENGAKTPEGEATKLPFRSVKRCINSLVDFIPQFEDVECKSVIKKTTRSAIYNLISNYSQTIEKKEGAIALNYDQILNFFELIKEWNNRLNTVNENSGIQRDQQYLNDLKDIYASFWGNVLRKTRTSEILKSNDQTSVVLSVNIPILMGALDANTDALALGILMGDVLTPLYEKIQVLTKLSDFACKGEKCSPSEVNELNLLLNFISQLPHVEKMKQIALDQVEMDLNLKNLWNKCVEKSDQIIAVFKEISKYSSVDESLIYEKNLSSYSYEFQPIIKIVKDSNIKMINFKKTGLYSGKTLYESAFGFTKENKETVIEEAKKTYQQIDNLVNDYQNKRMSLINQILVEKDTEGTLDRLKNELKSGEQEFAYILSDIGGLQYSLFYAKENFAKYNKSFMEAKNSTKWKNLYQNSKTMASAVNFQVNAKSLPFIPKQTENFDITQYALKKGSSVTGESLKISASKGDMINISVKGSWSPTCALGMSSYSSEQILDAKVGPEGYALVFENNQIVVESTSKYKTIEQYSGSSTSTRGCAGVNGIAFVSSTSAQTCAESFSGEKSTDGETTSSTRSNSNSKTATFNAGLRLKDTPFPNYPVGSLLLIELPKDKKTFNEITGAYVIGREFSLLTRSDSDYYLLGNDCPGKDESSNLVGSIEQYTPLMNEAVKNKRCDVEIFGIHRKRRKSIPRNWRNHCGRYRKY